MEDSGECLRSTMTNQEMSFLAYLADYLVSNPKKYQEALGMAWDPVQSGGGSREERHQPQVCHHNGTVRGWPRCMCSRWRLVSSAWSATRVAP